MQAVPTAHDAFANATVVHDAEAVRRALDKMAQAITAVVADKNPVILAVMNGGAFVATELCRRFEFLYEFDYAHATRYGRDLIGGDIEWRVFPSERLTDRVVVVVDDILDRGNTLAAILDAIETAGASEVYSTVLVRKRLRDGPSRPEVDFVGLETDDVYLFGCGMDYAGYWRGLPALYGLRGA